MDRTRIEAGTYGWVSKVEDGLTYLPAILTKAIDKTKKEKVHVTTLWQRPGVQTGPIVCSRDEFLSVDSKEAFESTADMMTLGNVTRPIILHNLRQRFFKDCIYTSIGSILVSVNPYKLIDNLYSPKTLSSRINSEEEKLPPHIYDIAKMAYRELLRTKHTQSVVISGESGAGKTEAMKFVLAYLTAISTTKHKDVPHDNESSKVIDNKLEKQILASNPVLEAFGNACTPRNGNSSRFGKYTAVHFDGHGRVIGCSITPYLLEKSRIVSKKVAHDRNYHIFGHMLARAAEDPGFAERLHLQDATLSAFSYLRNSQLWPSPSDATPQELKRLAVEVSSFVAMGEEDMDAVIDVCRKRFRQEFASDDWREWFQEITFASKAVLSPDHRHSEKSSGLQSHHAHHTTFEALDTLGFTAQQQDAIFSILSAILHLGNIRFESDGGEGSAVHPSDVHMLAWVASLLSLPEDELLRCLTSLLMVGSVKKNYSPAEATSARDAFSRQLYANLFEWIMQQVNSHLHLQSNQASIDSTGVADMDTTLSIGVLDIFGFERMDENSFEQFCINYCNEKLHKFFIDKVLRDEMDIFTSEGIAIEIDIVDNTEIISLIEGRKRGISLLTMLDDQVKSKRAKSKKTTDDDQAYLDALLSKNLVYTKTRKRLPDNVNAYYSSQTDPKKNGKGPWFTVVHYAGKVRYNVQGFVEKTTDTLRGDLPALLEAPTDDTIRSITSFKKKRVPGTAQSSRSRSLRPKDTQAIAASASPRHAFSAASLPPTFLTPTKKSRRRSMPQLNSDAWKTPTGSNKNRTPATNTPKDRRAMARANATLGSQFRGQLAALTQTLRVTQPHFVRCLKPNNFDQSNEFDEMLVLEQMSHLGLKALPDIRHTGLGRRLRYKPFFQLLKDTTALVNDEVKTKLQSLLENIATINMESASAKDETCRKAAEHIFPAFIREIGLEMDDQVRFGYTKVFMKDVAHDMLNALGTRGRFMDELCEAMRDVATGKGTAPKIFRLRMAIRAALGVCLHQPELHIGEKSFSNVYASETVAAAKEIVAQYVPMFATRIQAFARAALFRCDRWRKYHQATKQLNDKMATVTSSLSLLQHEQHRTPLMQLIQACSALPYASAFKFAYVTTLLMKLAKAQQLIEKMDTWSAAKKELTDLLAINPMLVSPSPTDNVEAEQLNEFSHQIQLHIDSLAALDVSDTAPILVEAQRCREHLAEVVAHIKVLEEITVVDPLAGANVVQTKDILAAATLLGENLAKAESLGIDTRFAVLKPAKASLVQGKARVAHLIMLDEMTSALTPNSADDDRLTADTLAALAEPVLEALFGAGELGLGLNVVPVKKAQEQLDSVMVLVSHSRVLKNAAQAKSLKVMSDEFWDALKVLKEEFNKVDELHMDRRWGCVVEAKKAIAEAEALVASEHDLNLAHLRTTLMDVSKADGPVTQEYVRTHVKQLEQALIKAKEIGLRDREEVLVSSAEEELQSAKSILVHATVIKSCIDKNPLSGHGAGTDADITSAFSTANSAVERAAELCMFGVVAVADEAWALLVQLEQVNAHIGTLRQCFENIRKASTNVTNATKNKPKAGDRVSTDGDKHGVDEEEFSVSDFIADMVLDTTVDKADQSDSPTGEAGADMKPAKTVNDDDTRIEEVKGHPSSHDAFGTQPVTVGNASYNDYDSDDDSDDSDFEDLLNGVIQDARDSSSFSGGALKDVAKAAAMLAIYGDDVLEDTSHPELDRCVDKLREALVRAEELGMMEADLVVVTAGKELLQRFESKTDANSSLKSTSFASDKGNSFTSDSTHTGMGGDDESILALANGDIDLYTALDLRATIGDSECDVDIDSDLLDHSGSDESNRSNDKYQELTKDIEAEINALARGDFGGEDLLLDVGDAVSVCDSISSNDIPAMLSDMSDGDSVY